MSSEASDASASAAKKPKLLVDALPYIIHVRDMDSVYYNERVVPLKNVDAAFMGPRVLDKAFAVKIMGWIPGPNQDEWFHRDPYLATGWAHECIDKAQPLQRWSPTSNESLVHMALRHARDTGFSKHERLWIDHVTTALHITFCTYNRTQTLSQLMYNQDRMGQKEERFALAAFLAIVKARKIVTAADEQNLPCPLFEDVPSILFSLRNGDVLEGDNRFEANQNRKKRALRKYYVETDAAASPLPPPPMPE